MYYSDLKKKYSGKRVFVTGHTGFKGSWMVAWLNLLGAEVKGYALSPLTDNDLFVTMRGEEICDSIISDVRDADKLEAEITSFQPDFIFHLAAQPLVRLSYEKPIDTFDINVMGTVNVLNAVRKLKERCCVVLITTDKVYHNNEWHYPYRESDALGGYDPYSASKACSELVISSYRNSYFNDNDFSNHKKSIASARAGNVIGGGDWALDRIIPDIVRSLMSDKVIEVRSPYSVRPWQHVLESIGGYLHLGAKMVDDPLKYNSAWNFGPLIEDNITVKDLVNRALKIWGKGTASFNENNKTVHEAVLLKLDISKTINTLKWKPTLNSNQTIEKTIAWYMKSNENDTRSLVIDDIEKFILNDN